MSAIDALTVHWEEDGQVMVEELDRKVLSHGAWATVVFLYRERDRQSGEFGPPKAALRRYRKRGDRYQVHAKMVLSSAEQARMVADTLHGWFPNEAESERAG